MSGEGGIPESNFKFKRVKLGNEWLKPGTKSPAVIDQKVRDREGVLFDEFGLSEEIVRINVPAECVPTAPIGDGGFGFLGTGQDRMR